MLCEYQGEFLSPLEWRQVIASHKGLDLLLANPNRRGRLPSWADYYQLLLFAQKQYDYIVVDLPEVINQATAEFVRNARAVFIVCQPELPSVRLAKLRRTELESCEIPTDNVKFLVNRWERGQLKAETIEKAVGREGVRDSPQRLQRSPQLDSGNAPGFFQQLLRQSLRGAGAQCQQPSGKPAYPPEIHAAAQVGYRRHLRELAPRVIALNGWPNRAAAQDSRRHSLCDPLPCLGRLRQLEKSSPPRESQN